MEQSLHYHSGISLQDITAEQFHDRMRHGLTQLPAGECVELRQSTILKFEKLYDRILASRCEDTSLDFNFYTHCNQPVDDTTVNRYQMSVNSFIKNPVLNSLSFVLLPCAKHVTQVADLLEFDISLYDHLVETLSSGSEEESQHDEEFTHAVRTPEDIAMSILSAVHDQEEDALNPHPVTYRNYQRPMVSLHFKQYGRITDALGEEVEMLESLFPDQWKLDSYHSEPDVTLSVEWPHTKYSMTLSTGEVRLHHQDQGHGLSNSTRAIDHLLLKETASKFLNWSRGGL